MSLRPVAPRVAAPTPTPEMALAAMEPPREAPSRDFPCPRCGTKSPEGSRFCHSCGHHFVPVSQQVPVAIAPTPQPMAAAAAPTPVLVPEPTLICARCRGVADAGADFCKFCGARLTTAAPEPQPAAAAMQPAAATPAPAPIHPTPQPMAVPVPSPLVAALPPTPIPTAAAAAAPPPQPIADPAYPRLQPVPAPRPALMQTSIAMAPVRLAPASAVVGPTPPTAVQSAAVVQSHPAAPEPASPSPVAVDPPKPASTGEKKFGATAPMHGVGEAVFVAKLVRIAKDGTDAESYPIIQGQTDLGRSEGNIVLPEDPYLSSRHARILVQIVEGRSQLTLVDLDSVNGVYFRLRASHTLTHGDLLLLGQQVLRFEAVIEHEGARGPAMQHGVLLFGSPAPAVHARLVQRTTSGLVRDVFHLIRDEFVVGRESGDHTWPDDVFLSRRHAQVRREGMGFVLSDLGSSNGTFVRIAREHVLVAGDHFRVGHHLFRVDVMAPGGQA